MYDDMIEDSIMELGFVPSITSMISYIQETQDGIMPSRVTVHRAYKKLVKQGVIVDTGMNPTWALIY